MHPVEFTFYKAIVLITAALAIGFGITNIVYFDRIRLNNNCQDVSVTTATTMIWLNLILVIFGGILLIWSFFRLIFTGEKDKQVVHKTKNIINYPDTEMKDLPKLEMKSPTLMTPMTPKVSDPFSNIIAPGTKAEIATIQKYE
jgi:predicted membrane protein